MVNKPFLLLGLAAEYRSGRRRQWYDKHCGRPSDVYDTHRRTKLTAPETISRWLLLKNEKIALWATLSGLRGNVRIPSIAHWIARGRLYIRRNWTFFAISYGWDVISGHLSKSAFLEGGWVTFSADSRGKGASPTNRCWCQSSRVIALSCGIKISAVHHLDLSLSTRVTDRRTDGRTDGKKLRLPNRPRICSRGIKTNRKS